LRVSRGRVTKKVTDSGVSATAISCKCPTWNELALLLNDPNLQICDDQSLCGEKCRTGREEIEGTVFGPVQFRCNYCHNAQEQQDRFSLDKGLWLMTGLLGSEVTVEREIESFKILGDLLGRRGSGVDSHARQIVFHGNTLDTLF
jgi:hypothetical protein